MSALGSVSTLKRLQRIACGSACALSPRQPYGERENFLFFQDIGHPATQRRGNRRGERFPAPEGRTPCIDSFALIGRQYYVSHSLDSQALGLSSR
jgi:hypothetical protein